MAEDPEKLILREGEVAVDICGGVVTTHSVKISDNIASPDMY